MLALLSAARASQNPLEYNGGCAIAMTGDRCVALAVDRRVGVGPQTLTSRSPAVPSGGGGGGGGGARALWAGGAERVLHCDGRLLLGATGLRADAVSLLTDVDACLRALRVEHAADRGGAGGRALEPVALAALVSRLLYGERLGGGGDDDDGSGDDDDDDLAGLGASS